MALCDEVNFCPRCGTHLADEKCFGKTRPACPACRWVYFPDPKVAAAVVIRQEGKVLLVRRINPPFKGAWTLPAGFVDADEDPARAAERECLEETGFQTRITGIFDVIAGREHARGADILIVYHAEIIGGEIRAGSDVDQAGFFPLGKIPPLAFEATRRVIQSLT